MPATFKEDPIARGERYTIDELLADFDVQRWSVACREMQVRIMRAHIAAAHQVIDAFARHQSYETATMQSSVGSVLPVRIANALEAVGCMTVTAVDRMSDDELDEIDTIGEGAVELIRRVIGQIKRGETIERFEETTTYWIQTALSVGLRHRYANATHHQHHSPNQSREQLK